MPVRKVASTSSGLFAARALSTQLRTFFGFLENAADGPRIAVAPHRLDDQAALVVEHVIHAPGIGADTGDGQLARGGFRQAGLQLVEQAVDVVVLARAVSQR